MIEGLNIDVYSYKPAQVYTYEATFYKHKSNDDTWSEITRLKYAVITISKPALNIDVAADSENGLGSYFRAIPINDIGPLELIITFEETDDMFVTYELGETFYSRYSSNQSYTPIIRDANKNDYKIVVKRNNVYNSGDYSEVTYYGIITGFQPPSFNRNGNVDKIEVICKFSVYTDKLIDNYVSGLYTRTSKILKLFGETKLGIDYDETLEGQINKNRENQKKAFSGLDVFDTKKYENDPTKTYAALEEMKKAGKIKTVEDLVNVLSQEWKLVYSLGGKTSNKGTAGGIDCSGFVCLALALFGASVSVTENGVTKTYTGAELASGAGNINCQVLLDSNTTIDLTRTNGAITNVIGWTGTDDDRHIVLQTAAGNIAESVGTAGNRLKNKNGQFYNNADAYAQTYAESSHFMKQANTKVGNKVSKAGAWEATEKIKANKNKK